jgi:hypothetical protein
VDLDFGHIGEDLDSDVIARLVEDVYSRAGLSEICDEALPSSGEPIPPRSSKP